MLAKILIKYKIKFVHYSKLSSRRTSLLGKFTIFIASFTYTYRSFYKLFGKYHHNGHIFYNHLTIILLV